MELSAALVAFRLAIIAAAVRSFLRRQAPTGGGPLPDVPDASPSSVPIEAPGMTLPYSSLDPFAPPKSGATRSAADHD